LLSVTKDGVAQLALAEVSPTNCLAPRLSIGSATPLTGWCWTVKAIALPGEIINPKKRRLKKDLKPRNNHPV